MNKIITRKEAKAKGLDKYFTGKPCKRGHISERYTKGWACRVCKNAYQQEYDKAYKKENAEKLAEYRKGYQKENAEKLSAYQKENRARFTFHKRNYELKDRMLNDAYNEDIFKFYEESDRLTRETGIPHNVDHIVPINGKNVSGLHVPWNLQVITRTENFKKHNKLL